MSSYLQSIRNFATWGAKTSSPKAGQASSTVVATKEIGGSLFQTVQETASAARNYAISFYTQFVNGTNTTNTGTRFEGIVQATAPGQGGAVQKALVLLTNQKCFAGPVGEMMLSAVGQNLTVNSDYMNYFINLGREGVVALTMKLVQGTPGLLASLSNPNLITDTQTANCPSEPRNNDDNYTVLAAYLGGLAALGAGLVFGYKCIYVRYCKKSEEKVDGHTELDSIASNLLGNGTDGGATSVASHQLSVGDAAANADEDAKGDNEDAVWTHAKEAVTKPLLPRSDSAPANLV